MSQENVEIVRRGNATFNRGDYERFAESWHPDIEFRDLSHAADALETLRGAQALLSLMSEWRESFDDFRAEISDSLTRATTLCASRAGRAGARRAGQSWTSPKSTFTSCGRGRSSVRRSPTRTRERPSKPWPFRSRRCRSRTFSSSRL